MGTVRRVGGEKQELKKTPFVFSLAAYDRNCGLHLFHSCSEEVGGCNFEGAAAVMQISFPSIDQ